MIASTRAKKLLGVGPSDSVYNPPMADSSQTNQSSNSRFSELQLGSSDKSEYQEIPPVDLLSIDKDELLFVRRQLLQRQERSKEPILLEVTESKSIIRKLFFALQLS
jgi:hypothetical protein